MNEQALKTVVEFNNLPETEEIKEIKRKYMNDEIGVFDFLSLATACVDNQGENNG